ncbi:28S ribosomal protein S29, mitochondrial [Patella vulgata]|uniref:28S ribosomal protein S29, mitochondrial n=1 Tax=Patella vulgata TaxID=6465 RepID=UPI00217FC20C|nr:28S ribosomal protein S29, mitochondrial [Patella vulgata]
MDAPLRMQVLGRIGNIIYHHSQLKTTLLSGRKIPYLRLHTNSFTEKYLLRCMNSTVNNVFRHTYSSTAAQYEQTGLKLAFRCQDNNPANHTIDQEGLFYTVSSEDYKRYLHKAINTEFSAQVKVFAESCIMIRKPALEMIDYIRNSDPNRPVARAIFYGHTGAGKTMSLCHVIHYCSTENWLIVHVPWPAKWNKRNREIAVSPFKEGRIDLPLDAAEWLLHFRTQNIDLLKELTCQFSYTWSKRESTEPGTPLIDIVDFGLSRNKFASDCVGVLMKEVKKYACDKRVKVLVAIDGVNGLYSQCALKTEEKENVLIENVSLVRTFRKLLHNDWSNGFVVCTVDINASHYSTRENHTPRYLLGKQGFEVMDPFIPVLVPIYTDKEIYSCLCYYSDRNWIQHPNGKTDEGLKEIIFLSNHNPYTLARVCSSR